MPVTLKREGAAYHETKLEQAQAPSASGIRSYLNQTQELTEEDIHEHLLPFLPEASLSLLMDSFSRHAYLTEDDLDILLHYCLLGETRKHSASIRIYQRTWPHVSFICATNTGAL